MGREAGAVQSPGPGRGRAGRLSALGWEDQQAQLWAEGPVRACPGGRLGRQSMALGGRSAGPGPGLGDRMLGLGVTAGLCPQSRVTRSD